MSALPTSEQTILVTGASGFVAAHVLNKFLEAGYNVRGTVRSESSAKNVQKSHAKYINQLSFAIVPDISVDGAFDDAVKGVDGVVHTASPFVISGITDRAKQLLEPAVRGTTNVLEAVAKNAPKVKRVVITSSFASNLDVPQGPRPGHVYSEKDWNPMTYEEAASPDTADALTYCASKAFAERAAFEFVEKNKPGFSVATLCPPMTYGPLDQDVSSMSKINTSSGDIYRLFNGSEKEVPENGFWSWVDVRDLATAHLNAFELPQAANKRFIISAGQFSYQMICDFIRKDFPELSDSIPVGKPGSGLGREVYDIDRSQSINVLGIKYRPFEETFHDTVESLLKLEKSLSS